MQLLNDKGSAAKVWELSGKTTFRVGRGSANDITLAYSWVSRQHAMIQIEENGTHNVINPGSANGTFVNGKQIFTPTRLRNGDLLGIGKTKLVFFQDEVEVAEKTDDLDDLDEMTVAFLQKEIVTILICDIRNFTRLSEEIGDHMISKLLTYWTNMAGDLVRKHDVIVDKFIGDAVMAMWTGGPNLRYNIRQALKTALDIENFTREINRKVKQIPWELRIGAAINTGEAVVGNIGVDGQRDFTVVGDTVNVAFRLEDMTTQFDLDILVGSEAASHLKNIGDYFIEKKMFLKGKETGIKAFGCSFKELQKYLA
ncbi:MAG: adenylate/guanylate cyclase domain-containing protein [Thermodesulfobacteriota bacterium]|nr:adenylate/guanylate cyclase domain-containing protein [Thermodesulfobacteriota bacterium]